MSNSNMHSAYTLQVLGQIKHAIASLDLKGTNDTVTKAMEIVSNAETFVRNNKSAEEAVIPESFLLGNALATQTEERK